jgi:hypothetical protein
MARPIEAYPVEGLPDGIKNLLQGKKQFSSIQVVTVPVDMAFVRGWTRMSVNRRATLIATCF